MDRTAIDAMVAHARAAAPSECCGLLLGVNGRIDRAMPARNIAPGEAGRPSATRFLLDPRDHFEARRDARRLGLAVVGFYHSHPRSAAWPSATDLAESAYADAVHAIVSLSGATPGVRLFWIRDGAVTEAPFELVGGARGAR